MKSLKLNIAILLTLLLWGSVFVGIRIGLTAYSPGALALLRFFVASLCMLLVYPALPKNRPIPWLVRFQLMGIGTIGIGVYNICLNWGEMTVSAGVASFLIGLMPIFTLILSTLFLKEKLRLMLMVGVMISFVGLFFILKGEGNAMTINFGSILILTSAFIGAAYAISQKYFLPYYHPVAILAWVMWGGTVLLLWYTPALMQELPKASIQATWAAIYMGVFPAALAYIAWNYVLCHLPTIEAAMYLYFMPAISTLLGIFLLHEYPSTLSLVGGVLALFGAFIATQSSLLVRKFSVLIEKTN